MPKIAISSENKNATFQRYPKVALEKGERARIACLEDPDVAYVHNFKKPEMLNGKPSMVTVENQKTGEKKEVNKMEFVSTDHCLGDFEVLQKDGSDPERCPACKESKETDTILPPQRKFAMHVAQYNLRSSDSWNIAEPFGVSIKAWTFSDKRFNELVELKELHGDLRRVDLAIGPCENKMFQNYKIQVAPGSAEYLADDARKRNVIDSFRNNRSDDLLSLLGRTVDASLMREHIDEVKARWQAARGGSTVDLTSSVNSRTLDESLLDLAGNSAPVETPKAAESSAPAESPSTDAGEDLDFDQLFKDL